MGQGELVLFAIRGAVRLGTAIRKSYIDSIKRAEITLPFPNFASSLTEFDAIVYFKNEGKRHVDPEIKALVRRSASTITVGDARLLRRFHSEFLTLDKAERGEADVDTPNGRITSEEWVAVLTIRQWRRDPDPSVLQGVAGTLIDIGADYLRTVPSALNRDSREGKFIAAFLDSLGDLTFADTDLGRLPQKLFIATLDTIAERSDLLTGDDKVQQLVQVTTTALSVNVAARFDAGGLDTAQKEQLGGWAELVFRSVLTSAGALVLAEPGRYLGITKKSQGALVTNVGTAVLDLVIDNPSLHLDRIFGREGIETVVGASLKTLGEHPEILLKSRNKGLIAILSATATELSRFDRILAPETLPGLTRLILDKSGENLDLVWPDLANNPQKHLLLTAASTTLAVLSRKPTKGKWRPTFSGEDLEFVVESVFDELIENPGWLLNEAGEMNANLRLALEAVFGVLQSKADPRLSDALAIELMEAVLRAVALRKELLNKIPNERRTIVAAAIEAVIATIFKPGLPTRAAWQLVRSETIAGITQVVLERLAANRVTPAKVKKIEECMQELVTELDANHAFDLGAFAQKLEEKLTE